MGPQFTFKTFPAEGANTLSSSSPVLLSDCPESQAAVMDMDSDLKSLWSVYLLRVTLKCIAVYCICVCLFDIHIVLLSES